MDAIRDQMETIQRNQPVTDVTNSDDEGDEVLGPRLVTLNNTTRAFLEAAFSGTMLNEECKKRVEKIGVPDCNQIRCPKLDGVMKAVLPKDAIKADGYLSRFQQFWLDAVAPLTAVLESTEAGDLMPEKAVSATQTVLYLMGNAHHQMSQERRKKLILKSNPSLRFMADDCKNFSDAAPMLFGESFAKQATTTVKQVKAIKKLHIPSEKKRFFLLPPQKLPKWPWGWSQEQSPKIPPVQREQPSNPLHQSPIPKRTRTVKSVCCTFFKQKRRLSPYFKFKCSSALSKEGYHNKFACWPNKGVHRELGHINTRSVGLTDSAGLSATLGISTTSNVSSTTNTAAGGAARPGINRDTVYVEQRGCECSSPPSEGVCLPDLSSPQEGRWLSTSGELESTEQVHCGGALQDGGLPHDKGPGETRRLASQTRPERCLFSGSNTSQSSEISPILLAGNSVPISLPPIRSVMCPLHIHQADEASSRIAAREGNTPDHLFGRSPNSMRLSKGSEDPGGFNQGFVPIFRPANQREEIAVDTNPGNSLPRLRGIYKSDGGVSAQGEVVSDPEGSQTFASKTATTVQQVATFVGMTTAAKQAISIGPFSSSSSGSDKQGGAIGCITGGSETVLPRDGGNLYRGQTRAVVVEPPSPKVQWHPTDSETSRHGDRDGCIIAGMGCNFERPRSENRGIVVSGRTPDAHQWSGATGSLSGNSSICQRPNQYQYSSEDGQYIDQSIHKPSRGDSFKNHEFISHSDIEVVHRTEDVSYCGAPSGKVEPGGRHRVTDSQGPLRLDDPSRPVCPDPESGGTIRDRLVCYPSNSPVTSILQLEAGSSSGSNRRFHSELAPSARICEPPMVPPPSYTGQDLTGPGTSSVGGPLVEDTTLVPNPPPTAERVPITDSNTRQHIDISNSGGIHHAIRGTTVGRLATIQQHCRTGRLSEGATTLLDSA